MTTYRDAPPGASYGLSFQSVTSTYEDRDGKIWVGTDGGGLDLFDPQKETFRKYPQTAGMKVVSIMPYSDSELLLSLFGVGLYHFNKNTGECREFLLNWGHVRKDLFYEDLIRLFPLDEDCFCLLSDNHLSVYNRRKQQFESLPKICYRKVCLHPVSYKGDSVTQVLLRLCMLDILIIYNYVLWFVRNEDIGTILA